MPTKRTTQKDTAVETAPKDVETIAPEPDVVELSSGSVVRVKPIKTRETFALLKIVSRGAGPILAEVAFNREDQDAFASQMIGLIVMAIPEAVEETIEFVQIMCEPVKDFIEQPRTKEQRKHNEELLTALYEELENPELDDLIAIVSAIAINEAPHMMALGKRLAALFEKINSGRATATS